MQLLSHEQEQADSVKLDVMWRPSLPKLEAGKSDNDCPDPEDYCEVCIDVTDALHLNAIYLSTLPFVACFVENQLLH